MEANGKRRVAVEAEGWEWVKYFYLAPCLSSEYAHLHLHMHPTLGLSTMFADVNMHFPGQQ